MADATLENDRRSGAHPDPGERGRLVIDDRVVERLATFAAADVQGVVRERDMLRSAVGRALPRASARVSGRVAAVDVDLAVAWGPPLDDLAASVRQSVHEQVRTLAGLDVTRVNVTVRRIVRARTQEPRVR